MKKLKRDSEIEGSDDELKEFTLEELERQVEDPMGQDYVQLLHQESLAKEYIPTSGQRQQTMINNSLKAMYQILDKQFQQPIALKNLCEGKWLEDKKAVLILRRKGILMHSMGFHQEGKFYLQAEEALFLLDRQTLVLHSPNGIYGHEFAYQMLLEALPTPAHYFVYAYLKKLGFSLKRQEDATYKVWKPSILPKDEPNFYLALSDANDPFPDVSLLRSRPQPLVMAIYDGFLFNFISVRSCETNEFI